MYGCNMLGSSVHGFLIVRANAHHTHMHLGLAPACERHIWPVVIITLASFLIIGAYSCQVSKDFDVALTAGTQTEELPTPLLLHLCLQF
jgi:hypothetical protein